MVSYPEDFNPVLRKWQQGVLLNPQLLLKSQLSVKNAKPREVKEKEEPGENIAAPGVPQPVKRKSFWDTSRSLMKNYCKYSTIHGIRFAAADDVSHVMRIFWACALIGATIIAVYICQHFFAKAMKYPTTIRVAEDHLELYNVVFPAIALCPTNRVRLSVARNYIQRELEKSNKTAATTFLRLPDTTAERQIRSFVTAMSHFEIHTLMASEVLFRKSQKLLAALVDMNVTDFMIQTLPRCSELLGACTWHGVPFNCCKKFVLQQSPIGYCYAFNSLTTFERKNCTAPEDMSVARIAYHTLSSGPGCQLNRTTGFGVGSGLRIIVKKLKDEYGADGVEEMLMVAPYSPVRYPRAGSFLRIRPNHNQNLLMAISLENTAMSEDVGSMDHKVIQCIGSNVPKHLKLRTLKVYTHHTCTLECRLEYMKTKCGCYPYFFGEEPQCRTTDMIRCIHICNIAEQIQWQLPPDQPEILRHFGKLDRIGVNCTKCIPRCQTLVYHPDVMLRYTKTHSGVIDIYYRDLTAAKLFRVDRTYAYVDIATYLGSIAGLCLGCSILSVVEITFYLTKLIYLGILHYGEILDAVWNQRDKTKYSFRFRRQ